MCAWGECLRPSPSPEAEERRREEGSEGAREGEGEREGEIERERDGAGSKEKTFVAGPGRFEYCQQNIPKERKTEQIGEDCIMPRVRRGFAQPAHCWGHEATI